MITEQMAKQQLVRLQSLRNPPLSTDEIIAIYRDRAKNASHAARMTNWLLAKCQYFPVPQEVGEAASETVTDADFVKQDRSCSFCAGTGWQHAWELITYNRTANDGMYKSRDIITDAEDAARLMKLVDGKDQRVYDGVIRCKHCGYGASLATVSSTNEQSSSTPKRKGNASARYDTRKASSGDRS